MANTGIYNSFKTDLMNGVLNLSSDTIKAALMGSGFVFNASHTKWSDVSEYEVSGENYISEGCVLQGKTITNVGQTAVFDASNTLWHAITITAHAVVLVDTTAIDSPLICAFDFGTNQAVVNSNFSIRWATTGIMILS
jgi:hypothetical protein